MHRFRQLGRGCRRARPAGRPAAASGGPGARRCRPAPRRPPPRTAGPGRRPASAAPSAGPPPAAGPSGSATPSTSRRPPRRRAAAGCRRRGGTGCGCLGSQPSSRCRVDARRSPSRARSLGRQLGRGAPDRLLQPGGGLAGRRGQRDPRRRVRAGRAAGPAAGRPWWSCRCPVRRPARVTQLQGADRRRQPLRDPARRRPARRREQPVQRRRPAASASTGRRVGGEAVLRAGAGPAPPAASSAPGRAARRPAAAAGRPGRRRRRRPAGSPRTPPATPSGSGQGSSDRSTPLLGLVEHRLVEPVAGRCTPSRCAARGRSEPGPAAPGRRSRRRSGRWRARCARRPATSTPAALNVASSPCRSCTSGRGRRRPGSRRRRVMPGPRPAGRTARRPAPAGGRQLNTPHGTPVDAGVSGPAMPRTNR